ncbi:hypothetical protein EVAR_70801_1 [Eumeta japonica]|uniref:(+)RNA virus helicase C-terminal domain-containing protein n=1 Tax=Eumeta variegata TaxID=151549 RepID=A0A4C1SC41_EUMVA|nr:hypothetical protein EVAR_70801_1 [Eumeta japonica]
MDVAYVLNDVYSGIYSSLTWGPGHCEWRDIVTRTSRKISQTHFLTYTQVEKESLVSQGYEKGEGTCVLTIHEAQGLTSEGTVIVRITEKHKTHDIVSHAMVAITRHTVSCVYYTDNGEDAIGRFMKKAVAENENKIKDNNAK